MNERWRAKFLRFGQEKIRPSLFVREKELRFDRNLYQQMAEQGLFRILTPLHLGGLGQGLDQLTDALRGLGAGGFDIPFGVSSVASLIATDILVKFGSPIQQRRYLEPLMNGELVAAICNSEAGAGTDIRAIRSSLKMIAPNQGRAEIEKRGGTNLTSADLIFCSVWKQADGKKPSLEIIVLEGSECFQLTHVNNLAGFKTGLTGSAIFRDLIPDVELRQLGRDFTGFDILKHCFNLERLLIGAVVSGTIEGLISEALSHIQKKSSFGNPLANYQYVQDKIISLYSAHNRIQSLIEAVVKDRDTYTPEGLAKYTRNLAVIKMATIDDGHQAFNAFFEVFGFLSYTSEHLAQKIIRDHLALKFLGGSKEQQKILLFSELLAAHAAERKAKPKLQNSELTKELGVKVNE